MDQALTTEQSPMTFDKAASIAAKRHADNVDEQILQEVIDKPESMQHWNDNICCAIDCETTGLNPELNEIIMFACVPLDSNFDVRQDVTPFVIYLKPDRPEFIDDGARRLWSSNSRIMSAFTTGVDQIQGADMFEKWVGDLGLRFTKYKQTRKRIMPLGHNYAFDKGFIVKWLGTDMYDYLFDYHFKDSMIAANYINDCAAMHGEQVPYSKVKLGWLAFKHHIPHEAHDALQDALVTAKVYKALCKRGLLA